MARTFNQFHANPAAEIGASLGRALFGDPAAAAAQQQQQGEVEAVNARRQQAEAQARLLRLQGDGVSNENIALQFGLGNAIAAMQPAPPPETLDEFLSPEFKAQGSPIERKATAFSAGVPELLNQLIQGGNGKDASSLVRAFAAFGGGDETARRGMVAGGDTPGAAFALTADRADQIAANDDAAKLAQALGVARINNASDIPVAQIQADASRYGADTRATSARYGTDARNRYTGGWTPRARNGGDNDDAAVDGKISGAARYLGLGPTDDLTGVDPRRIAMAMTLSEGGPGSLAARNRNPGNLKNRDGSFQRFNSDKEGLAAATALVQRKLASGQTTIQTLIEGLPVGGGRSPARPSLPRAINKTTVDLIDTYINEGGAKDVAGPAREMIRTRARQLYQQTGDPVSAVQQAIQERRADGRRILAKRNERPAGLPAGAKKAPDGRWVVQKGGQWYEVQL